MSVGLVGLGLGWAGPTTNERSYMGLQHRPGIKKYISPLPYARFNCPPTT